SAAAWLVFAKPIGFRKTIGRVKRLVGSHGTYYTVASMRSAFCAFWRNGRFAARFNRGSMKRYSAVFPNPGEAAAVAATNANGSRCRRDERRRKGRELPKGRELWTNVVKLLRAHGGCLGVRRLGRAWKTAKSSGELSNKC